MPIEGVDYAFSQPSASALVAAGKKFACRYGGPGSAGKHLSAAELTALKNKGVEIVANAEGAARGFTGSAAGRSWAQQALASFKALGMPDDRPIYYSVDWDAGPADWPGIDAALKAAAAESGGVSRVGVYGSYDTIAHCVSAGTARWFWQTYAWSGGRWHPKAHIQQYRNGVSIGGADCDLDRAMVADYGQWGGDEDVFTDADKTWLTATITSIVKQQVTQAVDDHLKLSGWSEGYPGRTEAQHFNDMQVARNYATGHPDAKGQQVAPTAPMARWTQAADIIIAQHGSVHASAEEPQ